LGQWVDLPRVHPIHPWEPWARRDRHLSSNAGQSTAWYVPGIIAAVVNFVLGVLFARIVRQIVTGFLEGVGADKLGERVGLSQAQSAMPLSTLIGTVVYVIIMVTVIGQALAALNLDVLTNISEQVWEV